MKNILLSAAISTLLFSCNMKERADLIVYNAKVYKVDSAFSKCTAFAVIDGKIIATGGDDEILNKYKSSEYLDAEQKPLYPGFNDAHAHFFGLGESLNVVDLRGAKSFEEVISRLQNAKEKKGLKFIIGDGWDQNDWSIQQMPSNNLLNEKFPDVPVMLSRIDYHAVVANDAAIKLLGITPGDGSIPHGEAVMEKGKFTGLFLETTAERFRTIIPEPTLKEYYGMMEEAQNECFKYGLTSVSTAGENLDKIRLLQQFQKSGDLKIRMDIWLSANKENIETFKRPFRDDLINIGTLKLYLDGALGSRGALMIEPFSDDPGNKGIKVISDSDFRSYLKWAYDNGFQAATHCIGDLANRTALREYAAILGVPNDRRWRIEHAQVINPSDMNMFGKYSIIPSVQPTHATSDMIWAADRLGNRISQAYPNKELLMQNGWLPSGTDFPVEEVSTIKTFFAAVFRKNSDYFPMDGFQMENALTREEALRSMTIWAAKASFEESQKGSIEPGKFADFVILDVDIMTAPEKEILATKVLKTYVAGKKVYSQE